MATVTKPCPGDPATLPTTITEVRFTPTMAMARPHGVQVDHSRSREIGK